MNTKKPSTSLHKTADDVRMTIALGHYIKAQLNDGVDPVDITVALEESLKTMEILHDQTGQRPTRSGELPITTEVSELLLSISRKAGESIKHQRP